MSSPLELLPPELFTQLLSTISLSQTHPRHHQPTFLSLSLVSKTCRVYCTPYIFTRLFFKETCLEDSETGVERCVITLAVMGVLGFVEGVDVVVPMRKGRCEWEWKRERVVGLLGRFTGLERLYVRTGEVLSVEVVREVQRVLMDCCFEGFEGGKSLGHYWWWYSMEGRDDARVAREERSKSISGCRMVRFFGCNKQRTPLVLPDKDIRHRRIAQEMKKSSRWTYLFQLG
jgi:hypothetical protein